jgi:ATP-binding cassette subfamily B protein
LKLTTVLIFISNYLNIFRNALPILWRTVPKETTFILLALIVQGVIPSISLLITREIIDRFVESLAQGDAVTVNELGLLVVVWITTILLEALLGPWIAVVQGNINEKLTAHINLVLMKKAASFHDLYYFENVDFYNELEIIKQGASYQPLNLLVFLVNSTREIIVVMSMLLLLVPVAWWLPLLVLLAALPQTLITARLQQNIWETTVARSKEARQMQYYSAVMLTDTYAKEVRLFGLSGYFIDHYWRTFQAIFQAMKQVRLRQAYWSTMLVIVSGLGNAFAFYYVVQQAVHGEVTPGSILVFIQSLSYIQQNLALLAQDSSLLYDTLLYMQQLLRFLDRPPTLSESAESIRPSGDSAASIRLDNVGFSYPDGRQALSNVSFEVKAGEIIAIVGENGAGKSTLVKLLLRLYDPSDGDILINDVSLRHLDLLSWRRMVAAVFQDFNHYALTVHDNIAIGNVDNHADVHQAAFQAGIHPAIEVLPDGYQTQLGKQFDGTELSGGQWQKLALARAFVRLKQAQLLIMDEPTASLDPRSEYEIYKQFAQLARGKTTLLITHRLASVRMADRILVFKDGKLIEQGTHEALLRLKGEYNSLWRMQAEQYQDAKKT